MAVPTTIRKLIAFVCLPALAGGALAQTQPTRPPSPVGPLVRSVDVTITNLDVIVTDSKGNRVTGLKKEDFEVLEDGLSQPVTNFFAVEAGRLSIYGDEVLPTPTPGAAPPAAAPAEAPVPVPKTRIVIFVDNLHLTPFNRNRVLRNLEDWLKTSVKGDVEAMIVSFDRSLKVRRKFTNDARDLVDVLRQMEEQSALGLSLVSERKEVIQFVDDATSEDRAYSRVRQYAESIANDLQFTFDAMIATMKQLSGIEGRKILLHVSEGLPQQAGLEMFKYVQDRFHSSGNALATFEFDRTASYAGVVSKANEAGVTIYTFDASGLSADASISAESKTTEARIDTFVERTNLQSMLQLMAEETGGQAYLNRNDVTPALKEVEKDYTSYYSLGYRSLRSGANRPHRVDVKIKKKGLTVRARRSYVDKDPETKAADAVESALYFPRDENPLSVGVEQGPPKPADRRDYFVPFRIRIPYARLALLPDGEKLRGRILIYFMVMDTTGDKSELAIKKEFIELDAKDTETLAKKDYVYSVTLKMIPGGQKLSLAVKDEVTGTMSYVQKNVFVSALPPEKK